MPSRTGTASQVDGSAGDGSTSVTVPGDATMAVAFWSFFEDAGTGLGSMTLGGNSFTIAAQLTSAQLDPNTPGVGVAYLTNIPGSGSQTLAWAWSGESGAISEGGGIFVVWVNAHNTTTPVRDSGVFSAEASQNVEVAVDTETTDLLLAMGQSFGTPAIDGTVFINNVAVNSENYDVSEVTASATTTTVTMTGENYSSMAAISLPTGATQNIRPDADVTTTGWTTTPLWSKIEEEAADGTVITATAS